MRNFYQGLATKGSRKLTPHFALEFGEQHSESARMKASPSEPQATANLPKTDDAPQTPGPSLKRRQFLKSSAVFGASALILPRLKLFGADVLSNKFNIVLIVIGYCA